MYDRAFFAVRTMCVPATSYLTLQVAHQDAQGDHFPEPGTADVCLYGARLACTPGVQVLTGPVIGEVTTNSAVRCEYSSSAHFFSSVFKSAGKITNGRMKVAASHHT